MVHSINTRCLLGIPEIINHYLLMYNLSMIARYETEWWYELLSQYISDDYVMIERYMEIAEDKFPAYIMMLLEETQKDQFRLELIL